MFRRKISITLLALFVAMGAFAKENIGTGKRAGNVFKTQASGCAPATAQVDLNINNVRATLLNGGDMWWNLTTARYEVPKVPQGSNQPSVNSIFSGAIWMGGIDAGGQLKLAAMTYRQTGNDFFPGPLDQDAATTPEVCSQYDRFWVVYASEIDSFKVKTFPVGVGAVPKHILEWPGKGNVYAPDAQQTPMEITQELAPFYDRDNDGIYNPLNGDYPVINAANKSTIYGDQMIYWVYNDKGNIHSETNGQAIGVQVGALAFAFSTSDEVNNMTFYRYNIRNKANSVVNKFYMGQWVDPDLGCYNNDYVGCDTLRGLGYVYNGTATDPDCASKGYGSAVPILGVDYFEGPKDDSGKVLKMSTFTYYNNDFTPQGNPEAATHYYNYMVGFWKDGSPFTSDKCNAKGGSVPTKFMFPGDPRDTRGFPTTWSECSCNNQPSDRRFLQSSGPFTLKPGDVNNITVGVIWVRQQSQSGCAANLDLLLAADRKAQALFDNNFKLVDGPDAPELVIRELENELIINISNPITNNNYQEKYKEADPLITGSPDSTFAFQGYKIYQLKTSTVSADNLDNTTLARLVAQVDIKDTVSKIINFAIDPLLGLQVPTLRVEGTNTGIVNSFDLKKDLFTTSTENNLINHKIYYFAAVAYAHNYYEIRDTVLDTVQGVPGIRVSVTEYQRAPYLQGRRNYKVYSAIPHSPTSSQNGTVLRANFGDSIAVTRIDGAGNGGYELELDSSSIMKIMTSPTNFYDSIMYVGRHSPISVKVVDPYILANKNFVVSVIPTANPSSLITSDSLYAAFHEGYRVAASKQAYKGLDFINPTAKFKIVVYDSLGMAEDSFIPQVLDLSRTSEIVLTQENSAVTDSKHNYGVSVSIGQVPNVGIADANNSLGYISSATVFADSTNKWLGGVEDQGTFSYLNWIRAGLYKEVDPPTTGAIPDNYLYGFFDDHYIFPNPADSTVEKGEVRFYDPQAQFGSMIGGTWAPYCLATNMIVTDNFNPALLPTNFTNGPAFTINYQYQPRTVQAGASNHDPARKHVNYRFPDNTLKNLNSVDLVLTDNKDLWTRCVVVEMAEDSALSQGHGLKGYYRQHASVGKDGLDDGSGELGRGWFPGYAINLETGERLNIMFGEDSYMQGENGADMIWNPTKSILSPGFTPLFGGKHSIYIMDSRYDNGDSIHTLMQRNLANGAYHVYATGAQSTQKLINAINDSVYDHIMWTSLPLLTEKGSMKSLAEGLIPTKTTIKLRVRKPYMPFFADGSNQGFNKYMFTTKGLTPETNNVEVAKNELDQIRAVPNPYYAYSGYETGQLDTKIKITNLPANTTISIFSIDGTLIRRFERSVSQTTSEGAFGDQALLENSQEWDLKNQKNIPISSGVYLIHINAPGIGEKVIKWFGVLRPTDLDTF